MGTLYINNGSCINRFYDSMIQRNDSTLCINENTPPVEPDKLKKEEVLDNYAPTLSKNVGWDCEKR